MTHLAAALSALILLAQPAAAQSALAGSEWAPVEIAGQPAPEGVEAFVRFEAGGRAVGVGGCNRFQGPYLEAGETLTLGPLGATRMFCQGPAMEMEGAFLPALGQVRAFRRDATRLEMLGEDGAIVVLLRQRDRD